MQQLYTNDKPTNIIFHNGGIYEIDHYDENGKMVLKAYHDPLIDKLLKR